MNTITPQDLKKKLDGGEPCTLVDVREVEKYEHSHIPSAINVPFGDDFAQFAADTLRDLDACIFVYGASLEMNLGSQAAAKLEEMGYTDVHMLEGGIMAWMEAGFMVDFGRES